MTTDIDIAVEVTIDAPRDRVWDALLNRMDEWFLGAQGESMGLRIEPRAGGRWYRDLSAEHGDGVGHFWGTVQVYKPANYLLEMTGPMAVSLPCVNHISFRLHEADGATRVELAHRGFGQFPPGMAEGVQAGWEHLIGNALKGFVEAGS